ncbi:transposase, partial [Mammaliicoccus sciuri]
MARKKRDPKSVELANRIIAEYAPESVEDMENALKDVFGPMFEAMLQGEMNNHLGYSSNDKSDKITENRRNGYGNKTLNTTKGNIEINVPRDGDASFEPQLIKKRQRDVSEIEDKVISMYAKGMSQRDISSTIEDIYGF